MLLALAAAAVTAAYPVLNHGPARLDTATSADGAIPLVPVFVIPYLSFFVFLPWSLGFHLARPSQFAVGAGAMLLTLVISEAIFLLAQSYIAPPPFSDRGPVADLLRLVYAADGRYNAFPSLHAGISTTWAIQWWRSGSRVRGPMVAWAVAIVASTVLVKQHYLADAVAGVALAAAAAAVSARLVGRPATERDPGEVINLEATRRPATRAP